MSGWLQLLVEGWRGAGVDASKRRVVGRRQWMDVRKAKAEEEKREFWKVCEWSKFMWKTGG